MAFPHSPLPGYDPELPATKVIGKWGSNSAFAKAIERTHSTSARWLANGYIPGEVLPDVFRAARRDSISLERDDLVDLRLFALLEAEADSAA